MDITVKLKIKIPKPMSLEALASYLKHRYPAFLPGVSVPVYGQEAEGPFSIELEEVIIPEKGEEYTDVITEEKLMLFADRVQQYPNVPLLNLWDGTYHQP